MKNKVTRRTFLSTTATAFAGLTVIPNHTMGSVLGHIAPSDKLNVAAVGIGSMGNATITAVKPTENIVALCDVDWSYAKHVFDANPNAKRYRDWRRMFDEMAGAIDAVIVATADHSHAIVAASAMTLGKHVYVEKPLTHSIYEARLLTRLAAKHQVATQMGNQGSSGEGLRLACDWVWNGEIGEVKRVDAWTHHPIWPQGFNTPKQGMWTPDTLDWDLFTGPARLIPYHELYHPIGWRGWWIYGTGALGDMACHLMHPAFKALHLSAPTKVQGYSTSLHADSAPVAEMVHYSIPSRNIPSNKKLKFPNVDVYWYDGGMRPVLPEGWPADKRLGVGGAILHGTKDTLICDSNPWLLSGRTPVAPKTQREVTASHGMDWVRACKESPENRIKTASDFSAAGPFTEIVLLGVLSVRLQGLGKVLEWDHDNMQFTNISDNDQTTFIVEDKFGTDNSGRPNIYIPDKSEPVNAKAFAMEQIKHTYREGWTLPAMP